MFAPVHDLCILVSFILSITPRFTFLCDLYLEAFIPFLK